jgi:putative transposase
MQRPGYWTDLTDGQWQHLQRYLPPEFRRGRKRKYPLREIFNALLYLDRTGCSWRLLPKDFPPYRSVFGWFVRWKRDGTLERLHEALHLHLRLALGREPEPTVGIIDSQSVRTTEKGDLRTARAATSART